METLVFCVSVFSALRNSYFTTFERLFLCSHVRCRAAQTQRYSDLSPNWYQLGLYLPQ